MSESSMSLLDHLQANIQGETWEVTHYMAMALKAQTLGMPEVAETIYRIAMEEAVHGANFIQRGCKIAEFRDGLAKQNTIAEDLKSDIETMIAGEKGAQKGKAEAAELASEAGHAELAGLFKTASEDEGRHAAMLEGLLAKHF